jgi:hypothetical protein
MLGNIPARRERLAGVMQYNAEDQKLRRRHGRPHDRFLFLKPGHDGAHRMFRRARQINSQVFLLWKYASLVLSAEPVLCSTLVHKSYIYMTARDSKLQNTSERNMGVIR